MISNVILNILPSIELEFQRCNTSDTKVEEGNIVILLRWKANIRMFA